MCVSAGPLAWVISVDPMLEELAASLIMSWLVRTLVPGCLPTQAVASQEVEAPLVNTLSLVTATQWTTDSPLLSQVQGLSQLTPPRAGQPNVANESTADTPTPSDAMPTPRETVALNCQFTKAKGGNHKATLANQEQTNCCLVAGVHTDLQTGRDTPHTKDGHRATGNSSFIRVQGNIR
jgi:hypothetical protein